MHERRKRLTMPIPGNWHGTFVGVVLLLLAGIGVARIISTYQVFSQTTDEPAHLATGMEWLEQGTYEDGVNITIPALSGLDLKQQVLASDL